MSAQNKVEINKFKIFQKTWRKNVFPSWLRITWLILTLIILVLRISSFYCHFIHIQWLSFSNFIFPGVTGLSFSITLLNATRNLFSIDDLVAMFNYVDKDDKDNCEKGDLFYRTITPYITASSIWLFISIISFISSMITIEVNIIVREALYLLFYGLVIAGFLNLWYLISVHIDDIAVKVNEELEK